MHLEYAYTMAFPMKIVFILVYPKICSEGFIEQKCYTEPGNAEEHKKQETPTINPISPTDKPHRPSTKHYRKDSLGDA